MKRKISKHAKRAARKVPATAKEWEALPFRLTRSEIDALRQDKKDLTAWLHKKGSKARAV